MKWFSAIFQISATVDKFIVVTFVLVMALAYPTWKTLVGSPDQEESSLAQAGLNPSVIQRNIASLPSSTAAKTVQPRHVEVRLDLSCQPRVQDVNLQVKGEFIQLQGLNCWENKKPEAVEIINTSNGYSATVFQVGSEKYQTDLIQLSKGLNELKIHYHAMTGHSVEQTVRIQSN
jgi:hypothetical protein